MAKAKTQAELAERFAQGDEEGTVTFLSIIGDAIFNTEEDKYGSNHKNWMALAIRLTENVAILNYNSKGSQWNDHQKKVRNALIGAGFLLLDGNIEPVASPAELPKVSENSIRELTADLESTVKQLKENLKNTNLSADDKAEYEQRLATAERKQRALSQFVSGHKKEQGKVTLDILTELPEILEKAVKEKHVDETKLNEILAARTRVKQLIEQTDKYLELILSLPTGETAKQQQNQVQQPAPVTEAGADITLTGQLISK